MTRAVVAGAIFGFGIWLVLRGLFPQPTTLSQRLSRFADVKPTTTSGETVFRSVWGRMGLWLLRTTRGELLDEVESDIAVTDGDLQTHAIDKLNAAVGGSVLLPIFAFLSGLTRSTPLLLVLAIAGMVGSYFLPDIELKRKAATRREEFDEVLTGFLSLVAVSISGGAGVNSAMLDTARIGDGWCFVLLRRALDESILVGEAPWAGLDRLGRRLNLIHLIELAGALALAGSSGARVSETLKARAESSRNRELAEARTEAEKNSESMGIPIAAMLLGWFGFIGYPAVANLLGS